MGAFRQADPTWWWSGTYAGRPVREILRERDMTALFGFLKTRGWSRAAIAAATGLTETRVRAICQGKQKVTSYEVLERVADGLHIDRGLVGLAYTDGGPIEAPQADSRLQEQATFGVGFNGMAVTAAGRQNAGPWLTPLAAPAEAISKADDVGAEGISRHHAGNAWGNDFVKRVPFRPAVLDRVALDWLHNTVGRNGPLAGIRDTAGWVNEEDLHAADTALRVFRELDHTHGGGRVHAEVGRYIETQLNRLLVSSPANEAVGTRLHALAAGFFELCGYQAVDLGADGLAQRRYLRALQLTQAAADRVYGGYLLAVNVAHLALHCNYPEAALRMALAAVSGSGDRASPAVRAALHAVVARAYARLGREADCNMQLLLAEEYLSRSHPDDEPIWIRYFTPAYLADEMAHCFYDLGRHDLAQQHVGEALRGLQPSHVRRLAIDTALLASSLAAAGRIEEACTVGRVAVGHAASTQSHRCVQRIVDLQVELEPHRVQRDVRDLAEYVHVMLPAAAV